MKIGYIPLGTKVKYEENEYQTDTACSRSSGTIRIIGDGPHCGFFVPVSELSQSEIEGFKSSGYNAKLQQFL